MTLKSVLPFLEHFIVCSLDHVIGNVHIRKEQLSWFQQVRASSFDVK